MDLGWGKGLGWGQGQGWAWVKVPGLGSAMVREMTKVRELAMVQELAFPQQTLGDCRGTCRKVECRNSLLGNPSLSIPPAGLQRGFGSSFAGWHVHIWWRTTRLFSEQHLEWLFSVGLTQQSRHKGLMAHMEVQTAMHSTLRLHR